MTAILGAQWPLRAQAADSLFGLALPDANGNRHKLGDYLGTPLVVNFWATWCPPCVKEMPQLDALQKKYPSVRFLGLAVDTAANVVEFTRKIQVSYPLLIVGHDGIDLMRSLGDKMGGVPFTVVFDAKGMIRNHVIGEIDPAAFERIVQGVTG